MVSMQKNIIMLPGASVLLKNITLTINKICIYNRKNL